MATEGTVYLLDTCVIVNLDDAHDFDAALTALKPYISSGSVRTSIKVMDELKSRWKHLHSKLKQTKIALSSKEEMIQEIVTEAGRLSASTKLVRRRFLPGEPADPWLIAIAKHHGWTVVTDETGQSSAKKIPGVCSAEKVPCIDRHSLAVQLGITLKPK